MCAVVNGWDADLLAEEVTDSYDRLKCLDMEEDKIFARECISQRQLCQEV